MKTCIKPKAYRYTESTFSQNAAQEDGGNCIWHQAWQRDGIYIQCMQKAARIYHKK